MNLRPLPVAAAFALALFAAPRAASADDPAPLRRRWGFGSAHGFGIAGSTLWASPGVVGTGSGAALFGAVAPTFELEIFGPKLYSIDLSTSLGGTIIAAGFDRVFYFTQDGYFTFHLGRGPARFLAGPGLGFTAAFREDGRGAQSGSSFRLVSQFGLELPSKNEAFSFKILGRPWFEITTDTHDGTSPIASGGFSNVFVFSGYFRR